MRTKDEVTHYCHRHAPRGDHRQRRSGEGSHAGRIAGADYRGQRNRNGEVDDAERHPSDEEALCFMVRVGVKYCAAKGAERPVRVSIKPAHKANSPLRLPAAYAARKTKPPRSEEHTSELQSRPHLVCRLLLEKKKDSIKFYFIKFLWAVEIELGRGTSCVSR